MRRFEQAGVPGNFFEVDVVGAQLIVRYGPRDREARTHTRPHASEAAAGAERDRLIEMHLAKGYVETQPLPPAPPGQPRTTRTATSTAPTIPTSSASAMPPSTND